MVESLIRSVAQQLREDRDVKKAYIGIGSGETGLERRNDEEKKMAGLDNMREIYTTSSQDHACQIECQLVEHFQDHPAIVNAIGGGGGRDTSEGTSCVYLATKRFDPPPVHTGPRGGEYHYTESGNPVYNSSSGSKGVHVGPRGGRFV